MSPATRHLIIVGTLLLVTTGVTIHLGRTEDIGWALAIVIAVTHVGAIGALAAFIRRLIGRRRARSSAASGEGGATRH